MSYQKQYYKDDCNLCGKREIKRNLIRVMLRDGAYGSPKQVAYLCEDCLPKLAEFLECDIPDLTECARRTPMTCCPECYTTISRLDRFCKHCGHQIINNLTTGCN